MLIGIEAQVVVRDISAETVAWFAVVTIAVWVILMAVCFAFETLSERAVSSSAVAAIDELAKELRIGDRVRDELRQDYRRHLERAEPWLLEGDDEPVPTTLTACPTRSTRTRATSPVDAADEQARLRLAVLARKRGVLLRLRRDGTVDDAVARRIQTRLDVEALRLTGPDLFH